MPSTTAFKNLLLAASDVNTISLHTGDPGAAGTANEVSGGSYARQSATFAAAASGERALSATVSWTGLTANQSVTYLGFWAGSTFRASKAVTGDQAANSAGEYNVTTGTKFTLADV